MPFIIKDPIEHTYLLTLSYKGKQYSFDAKMYNHFDGLEHWYIRSKTDQLITFNFNTRTKIIQQMPYPNMRPAPDDFMEAIASELRSR